MPAERKAFLFPDQMNSEARVANALEFIAHYLDRIEGHLQRLADQQPEAGGRIAAEIKQVQAALNRQLAKS